MVWFQCEDCGENLKKPKLANHFRMCSSYKLSCIDCGEMFNQESVQSHTQCITEAEKYGPKGQGNALQNGQTKSDKPKKNTDVDINVGLSSHAPWFCSLCNTNTTSKQTLQLHADGKKHRAKARAFHAAQKQPDEIEQTKTPVAEALATGLKVESDEVNGSNNKVDESGDKRESQTRKRKADSSEDGLVIKGEKKNVCDLTNGEVIQAEASEASLCRRKKKMDIDESLNCKDQADKEGLVMEASDGKIKWKKLIASTLKSSDGVMKTKKLQKLVVKALKESGVTDDKEQLKDKLMHKINSSTRFSIQNKYVRLVSKNEES